MKRWKLFAALSGILCLGVVAMVFNATAGQENTGSINGIVIDAQGKTVAGATVTVLCGNRPLGGRIPEAFSDERGQFRVNSLELDQCRVYACKEDVYVPCPPSNVNPPLQVTLTAKDPSVTVKVKLGGKGTVITGMVRDAISGQPLAAGFKLWQLKFPDQGMSMSSPSAFRIFISPSTDYGLEVSVPGYRVWSYSAQHNLFQPLRLARGTHLNLDVQLEPIASDGIAQTTPDIAAAYDRLTQPSETNGAAAEIFEMAKNDSTARDFLAGKLPSVIVGQLPYDQRVKNPVWANAVRLAGQLKLVEAIPALTKALSRPQMCGGYDTKYPCDAGTFANVARLDFDIVGRALADIGDPAVPVIADILSKGDFPARRRATWILINIDSPAAKKAMRDHLPSESNAIVKGMIEHHLGVW